MYIYKLVYLFMCIHLNLSGLKWPLAWPGAGGPVTCLCNHKHKISEESGLIFLMSTHVPCLCNHNYYVSLAISVIDINQDRLRCVGQPIMRYVTCSSFNLFSNVMIYHTHLVPASICALCSACSRLWIWCRNVKLCSVSTCFVLSYLKREILQKDNSS